jgi:hypothetical protein
MSSLDHVPLDPLQFSLAHSVHHPLQFFVAGDLPPAQAGEERRTSSDGDVLSLYPWGARFAVRQAGSPVMHLVRYHLPVTDVDYILAFSLGHLVDGLFKLMSDREVGAAVSKLAAQHRPATTALLQAGHDWNPPAPALIKIITTEEQWAVATTYTSPDPANALDVDAGVVSELFDWTARALSENLETVATMPGLVQVVGASDRRSPRMKIAQTAVGLTESVASLCAAFLK